MNKILDFAMNYRAKNLVNFYIFCLIGLYGIWKVYKGFIYVNIDFLKDLGTKINFHLGDFYVNVISFILSIFSVAHTTFITNANYGDFSTLALSGAGGVFVAYHCLGVTASLVYAITILLLPGKAKRKLFFVVVGLIAIFFVNMLRLIALIFLNKYASEFWFDLNHTVIFLILVYSTLLLMHFLYLKPMLFKVK